MQAAEQVIRTTSPAHPEPGLVEVPEPRLAAFYRYWCGKRRGRAWPTRGDIDPTEIRDLLPHMLITEVLDGGRNFRFRLIGTHVTDRIGIDATGHEFREFEGDRSFGDVMSGIHRQMLNWGVPVYGGGRHETVYGTEHVCRRVMCPLSESGRRIDKIISCIDFVVGDDNPDPVKARGKVYPVFALPLEPVRGDAG